MAAKRIYNILWNKFSTTKRQRRVKHKMENVPGCLPKKQQKQIYPELKAIFYQTNREKVEEIMAPSRPNMNGFTPPPSIICAAI